MSNISEAWEHPAVSLERSSPYSFNFFAYTHVSGVFAFYLVLRMKAILSAELFVAQQEPFVARCFPEFPQTLVLPQKRAAVDHLVISLKRSFHRIPVAAE